MDEKREFAVNTLLLLIVVCLAAYLVYDVGRKNNELAVIAKAGDTALGKETILTPVETGREELEISLFRENNHFEDIVTPIPTDTLPPQPSATPTEVPVLPDCIVLAVMSNAVQIQDKFGKNHFLKKGSLFEEHLIVDVDANLRRVLVRNMQYEVEKWIPVQAKK